MLYSSGAASSELDQAQDHPSRNPARSLAAPSHCTGCGTIEYRNSAMNQRFRREMGFFFPLPSRLLGTLPDPRAFGPSAGLYLSPVSQPIGPL